MSIEVNRFPASPQSCSDTDEIKPRPRPRFSGESRRSTDSNCRECLQHDVCKQEPLVHTIGVSRGQSQKPASPSVFREGRANVVKNRIREKHSEKKRPWNDSMVPPTPQCATLPLSQSLVCDGNPPHQAEQRIVPPVAGDMLITNQLQDKMSDSVLRMNSSISNDDKHTDTCIVALDSDKTGRGSPDPVGLALRHSPFPPKPFRHGQHVMFHHPRSSLKLASALEEASIILDQLRASPDIPQDHKSRIDRLFTLLTTKDILTPKLERSGPDSSSSALNSEGGTDDSGGMDEMEQWLLSEFSVHETSHGDLRRRASRDDEPHVFEEARSSKHEQGRGGVSISLSIALVLSNSAQNRLKDLLSHLEEWDFDVFLLSELTHGRPLFALCYMIFLKHEFMRKFHIKEKVLRAFFRAIEAGYDRTIMFHNNIHAAAVVHATYFFFKRCSAYMALSDLHLMAAIVAAAIHDYLHPGLNNSYQIKTCSPTAIVYNDRSVLENFHCAQAFALMQKDEFNIFKGLSDDEYRQVRSLVINMVLATDMAQHFELVGAFKAKISGPGLDTSKPEDVTTLMQMTLKCADICNAGKELKEARRWADLVMEEFYRQGDKERERNLAISAFSDRVKPAMAQCQLGFLDFVARPLFMAFAEYHQTDDFIKHFDENRDFWMSQLPGSQ